MQKVYLRNKVYFFYCIGKIEDFGYTIKNIKYDTKSLIKNKAKWKYM